MLSGLDEVIVGLESESFGGFEVHTTIQKNNLSGIAFFILIQ